MIIKIAEVGYGLVDAYAAVSSAANLYIQDQIYSVSDNPTVERAHTIYAGYAVTDSKDHGNVSLQISTDVTFKAIDKVVLKPGFHAHAGCNFHVRVDSTLSESNAANIASPQRIASRYSVASTNSETSIEGEVADDIESVEGIVILSTAVYTVSGQLLQVVDGGLYSTTHLPNGMYILQHRMSDGSVRCEKIANYK